MFANVSIRINSVARRVIVFFPILDAAVVVIRISVNVIRITPGMIQYENVQSKRGIVDLIAIALERSAGAVGVPYKRLTLKIIPTSVSNRLLH